MRGAETIVKRVEQLAIGVSAAGVIAVATLTAPTAQATPTWCTNDYPVAPPYAQCVNYGFGSSAGGYCWLNQPAYTTDGRAVPSSCAYYYNTPPDVGRPPLPQIVPPQ
jgi:hypothetical protein